MPLYTPTALQFNPKDTTPERATFAAAMTAAVFGTNFPHPDTATFRDRLPAAEVPKIVTAPLAPFKRGRHRRFLSGRVAG